MQYMGGAYSGNMHIVYIGAYSGNIVQMGGACNTFPIMCSCAVFNCAFRLFKCLSCPSKKERSREGVH